MLWNAHLTGVVGQPFSLEACRALVERILPILERLGTDTPSNVFYTPLRSLPQNSAAADRGRSSNSLHDAISQKLLPATRALHDYLQHDYLPKARRGLSMADLPLGSSWYEYRVRRAVGAGAVPSEIHRIGLSEVERLRPRLQATTLGPTSTPSVSDALVAYKDLGERVAANLPSSIKTVILRQQSKQTICPRSRASM